MDKYNKAILSIINEQKLIIGPLALDLAKKAGGISVFSDENVTIQGDPKTALAGLVVTYSKVFGNTSVQVSKEALKRSDLKLTSDELPDILR